MKRIFSISRLFVVIGFLVSVATAETLKVGVVLPLTGGVAEYGVAAKNGIVLAQEEFPELFKNVEFIYEDDRYEGKLALSAYQKLKTIDKVDLIYLWGIAPAGAVAPVAEAQKVPTLAVTCQRDVGKDRNYIVRFCYQGQEGGKVLIEYLRSKGYKKLGLVTTEMAFINTVAEGMKENLLKDESLEIVDTFLFEQNDFRTAIGKLKNKQFDAVGVFLASGQISQFYRQASELGFKGNTFGTDFFDSLSEVRDAKGGMTGAVFPAPSTKQKFVQKYRQRFENDLQIPWAANGYDFAILLGKYLANGEKLTPDQLIARIKKIEPFQGAANSIIFHESPNLGAGFDFPVVMKQINENEIIELPPPTK